MDLIAPLEPSVVAPEPVAAQLTQPAQTTAARPHIALDDNSPEASPPASFEVGSMNSVYSLECLIDLCVSSILLMTTRRRQGVMVRKTIR